MADMAEPAEPASFRTRLRARQPLYGAWCTLPGGLSAELLAAGGVDYVVVDLQHGGTSEADLPAALAGIIAAGAVPLVRPRRNDLTAIGRVLDLGAHGVVVPNVDSAEDARRAAAACVYPPRGMRSYGQLRPAPEPACVVMIESVTAVTDVEAIAAVAGVDGLYVGPYDLGLSLGVEPGDISAAQMAAALDRVRAAAAAASLPYGVHASTGTAAARWRGRGATLLTVVGDAGALSAAVRAELAGARADAPPASDEDGTVG